MMATSTRKTPEPKFRKKIRRMELVAEGSNHFLRGFKNPSYHFVVTLSSSNVWIKPCLNVVRKNPLACILNGLRQRLEKFLYSLSQLKYVFINTSTNFFLLFVEVDWIVKLRVEALQTSAANALKAQFRSQKKYLSFFFEKFPIAIHSLFPFVIQFRQQLVMNFQRWNGKIRWSFGWRLLDQTCQPNKNFNVGNLYIFSKQNFCLAFQKNLERLIWA